MSAIDSHRLRWRCRRGMLELDLLLQGFVDNAYAQLPAEQQHRFVALLECADQDLLEWLMGRAVHPDKDIDDLIQAIRRTAVP